MKNDIKILRDLAKEVYDISRRPKMDELRKKWSDHNSLIQTEPLFLAHQFPLEEVLPTLECESNNYKWIERLLRLHVFRGKLCDDYIIEPYFQLSAVYEPNPSLRWGVDIDLERNAEDKNAVAYKPCIFNEEDFSKITAPRHKINEQATKSVFDCVNDAIGDILPVFVDRSPLLKIWYGDISSDLARMRGLEQIMWDAYDNPVFLHKLCSYIQKSVLVNQEQCEAVGDFSPVSQINQSMPYSNETPPPNIFKYGYNRNELWTYVAAQEFTSFSGEMFNEFMLQYQIPIIEKYKLTSYGCCEDLSDKIKYLKNIKNLRRIAVTPFADVRKCAEQIGDDYVISWRPNPSLMICTGLDEDLVRNHLRENFKIFKSYGCIFDINLKDVQTIQYKPQNLIRWCEIVKDEISKY